MVLALAPGLAYPAMMVARSLAPRYRERMTIRNVERTGRRKVTRLSSIARKVEGVRGIDIDYVQYDPRCLHPTAFCESKGILVSDREWEYIRRHAEFYGNACLAVLVVENKDGSLGVKYYNSATGKIYGPRWGGEELLIGVLERARDWHKCPLTSTDTENMVQ